jgi:poly-gamma-glutamate synthesis protein (capsule biosynthesis protein)
LPAFGYGDRVLGAPAEADPFITLAAVGDLMPARGVARQIEGRGLDYPFEHTAGRLRAADITFGNLECALTTRNARSGQAVVLRAAPATAAALANAGFDVLSLANNHALDGGAAGLEQTMSTLRRRRIGFCGAGSTPAQAEAPFVIHRNGVRVAFVAFSQFGGEQIAPATETVVRRAVLRARRQADVVVASFHWGIENEARPGARQRHLARLAALCGADLILGHHPHVLQGWESLPGRNGRRALVVYSLGNFVFDQRGLRRDETIILRCELGRHGLRRAGAVPVRIERGQPQPAQGLAGATILRRLISLSRELGAILTPKLHGESLSLAFDESHRE